MEAKFVLTIIATVCWFFAAFPMPDPWKGYHGNLVAAGLFFFGLSLVLR